jgi:PTH2 family peptidyl-tRNA hydrolase
MSETKQVIVVRKDLKCRKGKMMAQVAHASLAAVLNLMDIRVSHTIEAGKLVSYDEYMLKIKQSNPVSVWLRDKFTKIVVGIPTEQDMIDLHERAKQMKIPCALITDCGLTEFHDVPTITTLALGPAKSDILDELTGNLILL